MAPPTTAPALPSISPATLLGPNDRVWRVSVDLYHEFIRLGFLTDDDPVELLEGIVVEKMPKGVPHRKATRRTLKALERAVPAGWFVDGQEPVTTSTSEPEPDATVIRGDPDALTSHPGPAAVGLVVEVADSTVERDRYLKQRIYAAARIPGYWIVNLVERQVEVYTDPTGPADAPAYRRRQDYRPGAAVPVVLDGQEVGRILVEDLLP